MIFATALLHASITFLPGKTKTVVSLASSLLPKSRNLDPLLLPSILNFFEALSTILSMDGKFQNSTSRMVFLSTYRWLAGASSFCCLVYVHFINWTTLRHWIPYHVNFSAIFINWQGNIPLTTLKLNVFSTQFGQLRSRLFMFFTQL